MNKLCHVGFVAFLAYITLLSKPGTSLFSLHPFCMALAYGVLMTEGVLVFTKGSLWNPKTPRSTLFYNHWLLNTLAGVAALVGFVAIYWNKSRKEMEHFVTYHGILGLSCVCYSCVQIAAGFGLKYPKYLPKWTSLKNMKALHSVSGTLAYLLGLISLVLAFSSTWYLKNAYPFVDIIFILFYGSIFFYFSYITLKKRLNLF